MSRTRFSGWLALGVLVSVGCTGSLGVIGDVDAAGESDAGLATDTGVRDATLTDARPMDSGLGMDTGVVPIDAGFDTGVRDTGVRDTGMRDTGVRDTGVRDTGVRDTGVRDTGVRDTGVRDTGVRDTGVRDTGVRDTGVRDTGVRDTGVRDTGVRDTGVRDTGSTTRDAGPCSDFSVPTVTATEVVSISQPVFVAQAPGVSDTLWVATLNGHIRLVRGGAVLSTDFLNLSTTISTGGERGLLGLAFHPSYATNRRFYVYYTDNSSSRNVVVAEYQRSAGNPDLANSTEVARLLVQSHSSFDNHNGGGLAFGPDGYLYAGIGDGGSGCDPSGNAQNLNTLLGKIARLDVDGSARDYAAVGNPFSSTTTPSGLTKIWAFGVRNPWRISFDRVTGDFYIGDVGQDTWEEIDFRAAGSAGGVNFGWRKHEGGALSSCSCSGSPGCTLTAGTLISPIHSYRHYAGSGAITGGASLAGGYVCRSCGIPQLEGVYIYGDYISGEVAGLKYCGGTLYGPRSVLSAARGVPQLTSFGTDNAGNIYVTSVWNNRVYRLD